MEKLNLNDYKFLSDIVKSQIENSYNEYDVPIDTEEHINKLKNVFNKLEDMFLKTEKLEQLKKVLQQHNKDSEGYLEQFFERCVKGQVDDLEWVKDKDTFEDFFLSQSEEYGAIYDFAITQITTQLLTLLKK